MSSVRPFLLALVLPLSALAGEYNESAGVAIGGYDPVAYLTEQKPVPGNAEWTHVHKGSTFRFASAANRDRFAADPARYAPQYNGYCAFGVSRGYKAVVSPEAFSVIDGKLYLNYNAEVKAMWAKDTAAYIRKADAAWAEVEKTSKVLR